MSIGKTFLIVSLFGLYATSSVAQVTDEMVARALLPLPENMRANASVITYDENGARQVLRTGASNLECRTKDENEHTLCYPKSMATRRDFGARLTAQGLEPDEIRAAEAAALAAGEIEHYATGSMLYRLDESKGGMKLLWVLILPNSMAADLGISNAGRFKSAVAGKGTPWMMAEGTPMSHVMIPVNGTDLSNKGGAEGPLDTEAIHPFIRATLPLPADLRRETTVVSYDMTSGERTTLRKGSNNIFCVSKDEETGFTRCAHQDTLGEFDLRAKLQAEGKSNDEISAAIAASVESAVIPARKIGSTSYRLSDSNDLLKLLWVIRLPDVTSAETGLPTVAEREKLGMGKGTPWLMREGTDRAHLMIPINGTALSNFY